MTKSSPTWYTPEMRTEDRALDGTWFRCRVHGVRSVDDVVHLGDVTYCAAEDCPEAVLLVSHAESAFLESSVWRKSITTPPEATRGGRLPADFPRKGQAKRSARTFAAASSPPAESPPAAAPEPEVDQVDAPAPELVHPTSPQQPHALPKVDQVAEPAPKLVRPASPPPTASAPAEAPPRRRPRTLVRAEGSRPAPSLPPSVVDLAISPRRSACDVCLEAIDVAVVYVRVSDGETHARICQGCAVEAADQEIATAARRAAAVVRELPGRTRRSA